MVVIMKFIFILYLQSKIFFSDMNLQRGGCENFSHGMNFEVLGVKGWKEQGSNVVGYVHENKDANE